MGKTVRFNPFSLAAGYYHTAALQKEHASGPTSLKNYKSPVGWPSNTNTKLLNTGYWNSHGLSPLPEQSLLSSECNSNMSLSVTIFWGLGWSGVCDTDTNGQCSIGTMLTADCLFSSYSSTLLTFRSIAQLVTPKTPAELDSGWFGAWQLSRISQSESPRLSDADFYEVIVPCSPD